MGGIDVLKSDPNDPTAKPDAPAGLGEVANAQQAASQLVEGRGKGLTAVTSPQYESDDVGTRFLDGKTMSALPGLIERAGTAQKAEKSEDLQTVGVEMFKLFNIPIDEGIVFRKFENKAGEAVWYFDTPLPIVDGKIRPGRMSKYISIPLPETDKPADSQVIAALNL